MRRWSLGLAITGFVIAILMMITLLVLWNVYIVRDYWTISGLIQASSDGHVQHDAGARWGVLAMGCTFFAVNLTVLSLYFSAYLTQRHFRARQTEWLNQTTHEFKIPLANIQLFVQTLQKGHESPEESKEFLGYILQETHRLQGLVTRILQARRLDAVSKVRNRIEVNRWVNEVAQTQRFPITLHLMPAELWIRGDRTMLDAVLENLFSNAMKYGDGTAPEVTVSEQNGMALIEVADRGIGIPPRYQHAIFRRFFRTPLPEHRRREGTGLGLHIAQVTVKRSRGKIGVRSNPGGGSIFWIRLPQTKEANA